MVPCKLGYGGKHRWGLKWAKWSKDGWEGGDERLSPRDVKEVECGGVRVGRDLSVERAFRVQ